jgi:hypothetical protein
MAKRIITEEERALRLAVAQGRSARFWEKIIEPLMKRFLKRYEQGADLAALSFLIQQITLYHNQMEKRNAELAARRYLPPIPKNFYETLPEEMMRQTRMTQLSRAYSKALRTLLGPRGGGGGGEAKPRPASVLKLVA